MIAAARSEDEPHLEERIAVVLVANERAKRADAVSAGERRDVLRFEWAVELQQVRLSRTVQDRVARRALHRQPAAGAFVRVDRLHRVHFSRLGHFSLDINERSNFQARELKTVYVPQGTQGHFLRLVLHKCHVNEHNLYNWSAPAWRCAPSAAAPAPSPAAVARAAAPAASAPPTAAPPVVGTLGVLGGGGGGGLGPSSTPRDELLDGACVAMLPSDGPGSRRAVANEAYDEAKRIKERMARLRTLGAGSPRWSARRCSPSPARTTTRPPKSRPPWPRAAPPRAPAAGA